MIRLLTAALAGCAVLLVTACSAPDPQEVRDSLAEITDTESPAPSTETSELDQRPEIAPLGCTDYLVITARGTGESPRDQLLTPVARAISNARPDAVQILDIDYPADTNVKQGATRGADLVIRTLNQQAVFCPKQLFILLGYSQGALIIGDALSEPQARMVGTAVGHLSQLASDRIIAIVFYGNPRFEGDEPYNYGTFDRSRNGLLPRPEHALDRYADRIRDFCVARDFICQSSLNVDDQSGHREYRDNGMRQDGSAFVIAKLKPAADHSPGEQTPAPTPAR